jgi:outer membrane protein assembly factor BamB
MRQIGDSSQARKLGRKALISRAIRAVLSGSLLIGGLAAGSSAVAVGQDLNPPGEQDWPWWRGPNRNGVAASGQKPPLEWNESENVLWKSSVPGRGHGSPTVVGKQVFLATADYENSVQLVLCYDRLSGRKLWDTEIHRGGFLEGGHRKSNLGSSTPASDGRSVFINFLNGGAVYTTALNFEGETLWQTKVSDFSLHQGFGSSPALFASFVIVSADNKGGGALVALDRSSGNIVWRQERPKKANYTSPIILKTAGREQLLLTGCDLVSSFDPASGKKIWEIEGSTTECVTSVVTDGKLVFTSGGYPKKHVSAVRADGSGEIVWEKNLGVYVPSMLVHSGYIYLVTDSGIARCWNSSTGEEVWRGRLGGTFSASPVLVGENIFATNEDGHTFIFRANPEAFELVGENKLGDLVLATPSFCGNQIFMRVAEETGAGRQEFLYCIGR